MESHENGWIKVNTNGVVCLNFGIAAVGEVVHDHAGY